MRVSRKREKEERKKVIKWERKERNREGVSERDREELRQK